MKRACPHCSEIKDSALFPFVRRPECYICYEKVTGTYQRAFRTKMGLLTPKDNSYRNQEQANKRYVCKNCWVESTDPSSNCHECDSADSYTDEMSKENTQTTSEPTTKEPTTVSGTTPVDHSVLEAYLESKLARQMPIEIRYQSRQEDSADQWRLIQVTRYDDTYITSESSNGKPYTYRRDRVIEIKDEPIAYQV